MNDRNRWNNQGSDQDYDRNTGRGRSYQGQQGGWGDDYDSGSRQSQQRSFGGGQAGGWSDDRAGDYRGNEWRGTRDWGDAASGGAWNRERQQDRQFGDSDRYGPKDRGGERSWSERAWGGSSLREGDRGLGGASGYGASFQRDNRYRPGSESFAAGYGMQDGPNYDARGWSGGTSTPTFGRGYGPDYGRDEGRGFLDRAGDEIASWFGDDEAERRRERDRRMGEGESHRGRGPSDYTRSDERIREDANDRLTDDHRVDARQISVTVDKGEVTLAGIVPDRATKRRAEDLVDSLSGVKHVQNNLRIAASGSASVAGEWPGSGGSATGAETGIAGAGTPGAGATGKAMTDKSAYGSDDKAK